MLDELPPKGLLFDYGGTLVEEVGFDPRAGNELLLSRAVHRPDHIGLEQVMERATGFPERSRPAGTSSNWNRRGPRSPG